MSDIEYIKSRYIKLLNADIAISNGLKVDLYKIIYHYHLEDSLSAEQLKQSMFSFKGPDSKVYHFISGDVKREGAIVDVINKIYKDIQEVNNSIIKAENAKIEAEIELLKSRMASARPNINTDKSKG